MEKKVEDHYRSDDLIDRIKRALEATGKDPERLEVKDLSIIDQLHTGGHLATLELAEKCQLKPDMMILDAGCGIGGTSRLLKKTVQCTVFGMDLVDIFIDVARQLTAACGMDESIRFETGDILSSPFQDKLFDCVWCQHILMNIADKEGAFKEFHRVLKPGGMLVLHEVVKGANEPVHLPVPWADSLSISFLEPWNQLESALKKSGFIHQSYQDVTDKAILWWERVKSAGAEIKRDSRPLGPHLIFGENGWQFGNTMTANIKENRIRVIEAILTSC